ncbi:MAG: hypothetical protein SGBAC_009063 [Bacillariaceae sp.]
MITRDRFSLVSPLRLYLSVATKEDSSVVNPSPSYTNEVKEQNVSTETANEEEDSAAAVAAAADNVKKTPTYTTTEENEEPLEVNMSTSWQDQKHEYLSLNPINKTKVCVSNAPHEWCLLWNSPTIPASTEDAKEYDFVENDDDGIRASTFVLQSVDRKVFLTCNAEGDLSTCTNEYLQTKQRQQLEQEQEEELLLDEGNNAATPNLSKFGDNDQGSFTWALEYEDESGMVVSLINTTYQRKLAILKPSNDDDKSTCTTLPLATKTLGCGIDDEDDAHLFPGGEDDLPPSPPPFAFHWKMRFRSGELLFLSNPTVQRRLRCDAFGKASLDENWKGWEVFRFVEAGHGGYVQITSWTHDSYLLYSNQYGKVGMTRNGESPNTLWDISRFRAVDGTPGGILLKSVRHDRYLSALSDKELATVEEKEFNFAAVQWDLEPANKNLFFFTTTTTTTTATGAAAASKQSSPSDTVNHHFLSSRSNGKVFSTKHGKDWEEWELKPVVQQEECKSLNDDEEQDRKPAAAGEFAEPANLFSIYSNKHQKYLGSSEDGSVFTTDSLGEFEYWELEESPTGHGYLLVSHLYGNRQLFCNDKGALETSETECQAWNLQPRTPNSISKNQMAVAGVAAATLVFASPLSLMLGAAARAPLAAMMVGGAEMVTAEAAMAYGVGTAVLGTSAVAILADHKSRLESKKSQQNELPIHSVNRPLVGWRSW